MIDLGWELAIDPLYDLLDYVDQDGRPLGERQASPSAQAGVGFELRGCPYPGGRHHHELPMNVSALRQARAHWPALFDAMQRVRWAMFGAAPPDLAGLWTLSRALAAAPGYLVRQGRAVPAPVAVVYKVSLGVNQACERLLFDSVGAGAGALAAPIDGARIHACSEAAGLFVSAHGVCAGSDAMIGEVLGALCDRPAIAPDGGPGPAAAALGDLARFVAWARLEAGIHLLKVSHLAAAAAAGVLGEAPRSVRLAQLAELLRAAPAELAAALAGATAGLAAALVPASVVADAMRALAAADVAAAIDPTGGVAPRPTGEAGRVPTPHRLAALDEAAS